MTQEKFKDLIEAPVFREKEFWNRISIKSVIGRTLRLALQYPELAQEYLEDLPKAVNENIPTPSNE
jgi:hypothetical protein